MFLLRPDRCDDFPGQSWPTSAGPGGGGVVVVGGGKPGPGEPQLSLKHEKNSVLVNQK